MSPPRPGAAVQRHPRSTRFPARRQRKHHTVPLRRAPPTVAAIWLGSIETPGLRPARRSHQTWRRRSAGRRERPIRRRFDSTTRLAGVGPTSTGGPGLNHRQTSPRMSGTHSRCCQLRAPRGRLVTNATAPAALADPFAGGPWRRRRSRAVRPDRAASSLGWTISPGTSGRAGTVIVDWPGRIFATSSVTGHGNLPTSMWCRRRPRA